MVSMDAMVKIDDGRREGQTDLWEIIALSYIGEGRRKGAAHGLERFLLSFSF